MHRYTRLKVWRRSLTMVESVYHLTARFPDEEKSGVTATMRRLAASVPSKIADAAGQDDADRATEALKSVMATLRDLYSHVMIARRLGFATKFRSMPLIYRMHQVGQTTQKMIHTIEADHNPAVQETEELPLNIVLQRTA